MLRMLTCALRKQLREAKTQLAAANWCSTLTSYLWCATVVGRRRTLLQALNLTSVDTEFNNHNSYSAVDFNVTYLVCHYLRINKIAVNSGCKSLVSRAIDMRML